MLPAARANASVIPASPDNELLLFLEFDAIFILFFRFISPDALLSPDAAVVHKPKYLRCFITLNNLAMRVMERLSNVNPLSRASNACNLVNLSNPIILLKPENKFPRKRKMFKLINVPTSIL